MFGTGFHFAFLVVLRFALWFSVGIGYVCVEQDFRFILRFNVCVNIRFTFSIRVKIWYYFGFSLVLLRVSVRIWVIVSFIVLLRVTLSLCIGFDLCLRFVVELGLVLR